MTAPDGGADVVALSVGDSEDLDRYGYGPEHIDEAVMRLGQAVLQAGWRIGYGGALRGPGGGENFTTTLIGVAKGRPAQGAPGGDPPATLINYSAWPFYGFLDAETQAKLYGAVRFVRVDPPDLSPVPPANPKSEDPGDAWLAARALSRMRQLMVTGGADDHHDPRLRSPLPVPPCVARVALGGKVRGWQGMVPGVAEEIAEDLGAKRPVYLIGAFGGCVRRLTDAFDATTDAGRDAALSFLTLRAHLAPLGLDERTDVDALDEAARARALGDPFGRTWIGAGPAGRAAIAARFEEVYDRILDAVRDPSRLNDGLSDADRRALMRTQDVSSMRRILLAGLRGRLTADCRTVETRSAGP